MPPKLSKKAEQERLAEEARLAKLAEQQRMHEERMKAMEENGKKKKQEEEWVEQQNAAFLLEEEEHMNGLQGVSASVDSCEELINKTDEWKRFVACSRLPDATSEKDVNSYITLLRDQDCDFDMQAAMSAWHHIQLVSEELDGILSTSRIAGETERVEAYTKMITSLQEIGWTKLNYATAWAMQNPMGFVNAQNVAKLECRADAIRLGLFINVTKALRSRTLDFPECGFSCDLPRSLVTGDIGIRFLYTSQDSLSVCYPDGDLIAIGGVLYVQILGMPSAPTTTNRGWSMRKAASGNDPMGLEVLTYPLAHEGVAGRDVPPIKISYNLPSEIFLDPMRPRVARWNTELNMWDEDSISEVSLEMSTRTISFKTTQISTFTAYACVLHRSSGFPYKKWCLFSAGENLANLYVETQTHTLQIEVGSGLVKLTQPQCSELQGLLGTQLRPGNLLVALRKRGINIMPSARDMETVRSVGVVAKSAEVGSRACYNASNICAGFAVASSHWNAGLSANDCMFRVRQSDPSSEMPPEDDRWRAVVFRSSPLASWCLSKRTEKDEIFNDEPFINTKTALLVLNLLKNEVDSAVIQKCKAVVGIHSETVRHLLELVGVFSYTAAPTKPGALSIPELLTVARVSQVDPTEIETFLSGGENEISHTHGDRWLRLMDALNIGGGRSFQRNNIATQAHTRLGLWPSVRLFIASTKADFENERDFLHRYVIPALRAKCLSRQIQFSVVDLLWGVDNENAYKKLGLARIFNVAESCSLPGSSAKTTKPFVLALVGDRNGWVPTRDGAERNSAVASQPSLSWINKPPHCDESLIALVMSHTVLRRSAANSEPLICIRDQSVFAEPRYRSDVPPHVRADFADDKPKHDSDDAISARLKAALRQKILTRCFDGYPCRFSSYEPDTSTDDQPATSGDGSNPGDASATPAADGAEGTPKAADPAAAVTNEEPVAKRGFVRLSGLEQLGSRVFRQLWGSIDSAYPSIRVPPELVTSYRSQQELLVDYNSKNFQGQEDALGKLRDVVHGTSARSPIVVLMGPPGSGRTSILARLCQTLRMDESIKCIPFFKLKSVSFYTMIEYLALELESNKEVEDGDDADAGGKKGKGGKVKEGALHDASGRLLIGTDMLLEALRRNCGKKRSNQIVVVLDGLEKSELSQISYCAGRDQFMESKFRCVVAAAEGVSDHNKDSIISLNEGLNDKDAQRIASTLLAVNDRRLDAADLDLLLKKESSSSPFYLKLAADEIAALPPAESLRERLETLPGTVEDIYLEIILPRLENSYGVNTVRCVLGWLSVTSWGLQESEMLLLLQQTNAAVLPQCEFILLCDTLRSILEVNCLGESETLSIGHLQMREAVIKRYLGDERELQRAYQLVAALLVTQADPSRKGAWDKPAARAVRALPELFLGGRMWADVQNSLGSLRFMEVYIRACGVPQLMTEYLIALKATEAGSSLTNQKIKRYHEFVEAHTLLLHADPGCIYQMAMSATEQDIKQDLGDIQRELMMRVEQAERNDYEQSTDLTKAISLGQLFTFFADAADRGVLRSLPTEKVELVAAAAAKVAQLREELWSSMDPQTGLPPTDVDMGLPLASAKGSKETKDKGDEDQILKHLQIDDLHKVAMFQDQPTPGLRLVMQAMSIILDIIPPIPPPPTPREPLASMDSAHATILPLTKAELTEFRNLAARPPCINAIAKGLCLVLNVPPVVKKATEDWWTPCKKALAAPDITKKLTESADIYTNGDETPSDLLWSFLCDFIDNPESSMNEIRATKIAVAATFGLWLRSLYNWFSTAPMGAMVVFRARRIIEVETFDHWKAANKLFKTWTNTEKLTKLDKRAISLDTIRALEPVVSNYLFDPAEISKVSKAGALLCMWIKDIIDTFLEPKFIEQLAAALAAAKEQEQPPQEAPKASPAKPAKRK